MNQAAEAITVRLEKHAYGGAAFGRLPDGRAVFVPFALPGEMVRVRLREEGRGHARGEVVEILESAADRITPRCRHFGACGGCHYQHLPYERQLEAKSGIVGDQFGRIGHFADIPLQPIVASPLAWNYRNHVQFHLVDGKPGMMRADGHGVMPICECHLPETELATLFSSLEFEAGVQLDRLGLRLGAGGETMLVLESDEPPELELEADISVVHLSGNESIVMAGNSALTMEVLGQRFRVSAGSFFQVNTHMAEKLVEHVLARLPLRTDATVLDVYCGAGLFSAFLAPRVGRLIGIEAAPSAGEDFSTNLDAFDNVELYEAPAEQALPALDVKADAVLVDPPRAGVERTALEALIRLGAERLVYVSCDPATLARDTRRLVDAGYRLMEVTPFDLFPQTFHIEAVALLQR